MKQQIVVLGLGMLGNYAYKYFKQFPEYHVVGLTRNEIGDFKGLTTVGTVARILSGEIDLKVPTTILNAAGIIKPQVDKVGKLTTIQINSALPHILADFCNTFKHKLIHASSDCCFRDRGNYTVDEVHDCEDFYGRTKSLGEPDNAIVVRTSIFGESENGRGLLEWVKSNAGKTINGFTNHHWNGLSCYGWCKFVHHLIKYNLPYLTYQPTSENITKYHLLELINEVYNLKISVNPTIDSQCIDRTLVSNCQHLYTTASLKQQIEEMKEFGPILRGEN